MKRLVISLIVTLVVCAPALAGDLNLPKAMRAGEDLALTGLPEGTLYLVGPRSVAKIEVKDGSANIAGDNFRASGRYVLQINDQVATFYIKSEAVANISFIARPSRVPAATGAVTGSAFLFDRYSNLVLTPQPVKFELAVAGAPPVQRVVTSSDGVAWVKLNSGRKEGAAQFIASSAGTTVRRVVQHVASDPCNLRLKASPAQDGNILVETEPIRDCSGNAVPDGTIVTFTSVDSSGRSTVDSRIKRGTARAELPRSASAKISAASGVLISNEISWGGGR